MHHQWNYYTYLLLILFPLLSNYAFIGAQEDSDSPMIVRLETESDLTPIYLLPFQLEQPELDSSYVKQLRGILEFDLNHNGSSVLLKNSTKFDTITETLPFQEFGSLATWQENAIYFVIKIRLEGKNISALILDINKKNLKNSEALLLSGDLAHDRSQIHRLADIIYKAIFENDGIATSQLLFVKQFKNGTDSSKWLSEVYQCDYDGGNMKQITDEKSLCITPTYIPPKPGYTAGGFLFVSYKSGQPKIYISSIKNGKCQRLTYLNGNQFMPTISKDRDKIAFVCDATGNPDLFLQNFSPETGAIGKPQQIFSARRATQGTPTFSPDGKKIAFVSNKDGAPKIYVITIPEPGTSLNAIKPLLISKINKENTAPAWSPNGSMIAYCARNGGARQLWIYDFKTNKERQITEGNINKENPTWAPNNLVIAYNTTNQQTNDLFIVNIFDPKSTQITFGPGDKRFPSWEPRFK